MHTKNIVIPISRPSISEAEKRAVLEVLESGYLAQGNRVEKLERRFAELCGTKHAVATSSGTTGLFLALLAHEIGPGDEVITTPFTFIATVNSILTVGARPVFVDIDPETFNLKPELIEMVITPRTKAIMPVHLYGYMCDMDVISNIAYRYHLPIIEDACQAIGATFQGRPSGSFGTGVFSLYATKNVTAGEGGMITTNEDLVADKCRFLRNHGMRQRNSYEMMGFNFRMSDIHAAIGCAQLGRLSELTEARRRNAAYLSERITSAVVPMVKPGYEHVWHQYTIRIVGNRDMANQSITDSGIGTGIFYPAPAHHIGHVKRVVGNLDLPVAEATAKQVLSLPVHPVLTEEELDQIVTSVNSL